MLTVKEVTDRAADKAFAIAAEKAGGVGVHVITLASVVWATLEVLEGEGMLELDRDAVVGLDEDARAAQ